MENNYKYLFLDDDREPQQVGNYILPIELRRIYRTENWIIVRSFTEFKNHLLKNVMPDVISLDHDLAEKMYLKHLDKNGIFNYEADDFKDERNRTGYHCLQWLIDYGRKNKYKLPVMYCHSLNPIGKANIENLIALTNNRLPSAEQS